MMTLHLLLFSAVMSPVANSNPDHQSFVLEEVLLNSRIMKHDFQHLLTSAVHNEE